MNTLNLDLCNKILIHARPSTKGSFYVLDGYIWLIATISSFNSIDNIPLLTKKRLLENINWDYWHGLKYYANPYCPLTDFPHFSTVEKSKYKVKGVHY